MARKSDKDMKIEALENSIKNLEEEKRTRDRWNSIPAFLQVAIIAIAVVSLFSIVIYFYVEIRRAIDIALISNEDYQRIIMVVDDTSWEIAKSSFSDFQETFNDKGLNGNAYISFLAIFSLLYKKKNLYSFTLTT